MKNFLLALILAVSFTVSAADEKSGHQRVSVDAFHKLWKDKKLTVIDVRAKNIDYRNRNFRKRIGKLDKSKEYLVHCRSGGRSAAASNGRRHR